MITVEALRDKDPRDTTVPIAYTLLAMIQCARITLEHDCGGAQDANRVSSAAIVLELAESLAAHLTDGVEGLEVETKRGVMAGVRAVGDPSS